MRWLLVLPAFLIFGCAETTAGVAQHAQAQKDNELKLAQSLKGLTPAETSECIDLRYANNDERFGDTILYKVSRKLIYRTDTGGGCFGLDRGDTIVTRSFNGRLCRGDIATTVDPTSRTQTGSCVIGTFTTYRAAK